MKSIIICSFFIEQNEALGVRFGMSLVDGAIITDRSANTLSHPGLSALQIECIDLFVRIAQFLGLAKSLGELFGLVFLADGPISLDECSERLDLSKGAASQGLKQLKALGAIKLAYVPGDRRDRYVAEDNLNLLVAGFLKERVQPGLMDLHQRIENLESKIETLPVVDKQSLQQRLRLMRDWQEKAQMIIPTVNKLMNG